MLLGKHTPVVATYSPELLYPIARSTGRAALGLDATIPFHGIDLWHAWELSWLDGDGKPVVRVGRLRVPADSPAIIESKSLKLYFNSLNSTRFPSEIDLAETLRRDLGAVAGAAVGVELFPVDAPDLATAPLPGTCLDDLPATVPGREPAADLLRLRPAGRVEERLYSHLLRSLCPVTAQPDWASVLVHYRGPALQHRSLLEYLIAYRDHREFHEHCVERIYRDLYAVLQPELLSVQACYTRRGGLDINPLRSSDPASQPLPRVCRQ